MSEFLFHYGLFLAKAVTLVAVAALLAAVLVNALQALRSHSADHLEVKNLNRRFRALADAVQHELLGAAGWKRLAKDRKKEDKARDKGTAPARPRVFVLDFDGDIQASAVDSLREEISAVLQVAQPGDEVLARIESPGGVVHGYGLAASQLARLRARGIPLTVAVDKVAASGGYLMACVAERILAAPFAIVGSIGVVAQLPNFNRLLKKHEIDWELHTAGEHKRTLTVFGENTEAGREKFRESLEEAHALFKGFIAQYRPQVDLAQAATGDHWFGARAVELKLVDELRTSDDWLLERSKDRELYALRWRRHRGLVERLGGAVGRLAGRARATFF